MKSQCMNAAKELPPELFAALTAALGKRATLLWVPGAPKSTRGSRDAFALRLTEEGHSAGSVAQQLFVSERTVRRILARARRAESQKQRAGQAAPSALGQADATGDALGSLGEGGVK